MNIKQDLYYIYNNIMDTSTVIICIIIITIITVFYFIEDKVYESQRISPVNGSRTQYTVCIQDPKLNRGFIVSLSNVNELKEIQMSLKKADNIYVIEENMGNYYLINNKHKREQIVKEFSFTMIKNIMNKLNTKPINYSV